MMHLRRTLRMAGAAIAVRLGLARPAVVCWLQCESLGRLAQIDQPEPVRRCQRERPGRMIHLEIWKPRRFDQPGHRVTRTGMGCRNRGAGWVEPWSATGSRTMARVHVAVDGVTRLACIKVLGDACKDATAGFPLRALRWYHTLGIRAERAMTENGSAYRSGRFAKALRLLGIRYIFTRPCTAKTNGKAKGSLRPSCASGPIASAFLHP